MSDTSSKVENVEAGAPEPQAVASESEVQENAEKCVGEPSLNAEKCVGEPSQNAEKCKGEPSQNAKKCEGEQSLNVATVSTEKVDPVIEKSNDSESIETDVKEQAAAAGEENVETVAFAEEWKKMYTAVKQPSAPSTSGARQPERRTVRNVQVAVPRPAQGQPARPQRRRVFCPPVFYWKAILAITVVMLALGFLVYAHRYLYASPTPEDQKHNAYLAVTCGSLAAFLGLVGFYFRRRRINIFWCCTEFLRLFRSARNNITHRVAFAGRARDLAQGDIESQITLAEIDTSATDAADKSISTSPKKTDGQGMSTERDPIFSSSTSDEASSSKMSEIASAVTSIVSETFKKGDKKLVASSDSKEGSFEVSTSSTETSFETGLIDSDEFRRRCEIWRFERSTQSSNSATQPTVEASSSKMGEIASSKEGSFEGSTSSTETSFETGSMDSDEYRRRCQLWRFESSTQSSNSATQPTVQASTSKMGEIASSKEGSFKVSTSSTETSSETGLMESGEIRRRKHLWSSSSATQSSNSATQSSSSATQSSDEESTKKD